MNKKALAMLSGGLDSMLAIRIMKEQGIDIQALNFSIGFCACILKDGENAATRAARLLGVPIDVFDITEEYLDVLRNPVHGYGANINPCIDCKIFMLKKAGAMLNKYGASFIITGEVLGERPMSQRRDALNIIDRDSGLKGIILRPLSAKVLDPTIPETQGVVDRDRLSAIVGRGRKEQRALAAKFGITEYPSPAGGCLLTDPGFSHRVKDLIAHNDLTVAKLELLRFGRHFRISQTAKLIVGRDEKDNDNIEARSREGDTCFLLKDHPGPFSLLTGIYTDADILRSAEIIADHSKFRSEGVLKLEYWKHHSREHVELSAVPADRNQIDALRIS